MSEVFSIRPDEWQVRLGDRVLPTIWNSRGAALAGLEVEARRLERAAAARAYNDTIDALAACVSTRLAELKAEWAAEAQQPPTPLPADSGSYPAPADFHGSDYP